MVQNFYQKLQLLLNLDLYNPLTQMKVAKKTSGYSVAEQTIQLDCAQL